MGSSLTVLTLLSALNPVRLGVMLLVLSRPRALQNLVAFWVGCLTGSILPVLIPLTLLHVTPMSRVFPHGDAASSTVQNIQIFGGAFALCVAALLTVRSLRSRQQQAGQPTPAALGGPSRVVGTTSTLVRESNTPAAVARLLRRGQEAWANGSWGISFVMGLALGGPQPDVALFAVAIIAASGAAVGAQMIAATSFVVGTFAVVEIILVTYLVAPAKTQAVLQQLHDWVTAHRQKLLIAIFSVIGVAMMTLGVTG